jgi:hypothetical protein
MKWLDMTGSYVAREDDARRESAGILCCVVLVK